MSDRPLWHEAAAMAARSHRHHLRKDGRTPYIAHPSRVALVIASVFGVEDESILAAAYLHDVIEDGDVDYDDLRERFGADTADYVAVMTKDKRREEDDRERAYDQALGEGPWPGRLIKLADVYDNMLDAHSDDVKHKLMGKADRILALVADEPRLAGAAAAVRAVRDGIAREIGDPRAAT